MPSISCLKGVVVVVVFNSLLSIDADISPRRGVRMLRSGAGAAIRSYGS